MKLLKTMWKITKFLLAIISLCFMSLIIWYVFTCDFPSEYNIPIAILLGICILVLLIVLPDDYKRFLWFK